MTVEPSLAALVLVIGLDGLEILGPSLEKAGYRVAGARNPAEGFSQAVALAPDFILIYQELLDETVARLNADGATERIRVIPVS